MNNPPVINSLAASSNRVEADLSVRVTAVVTDNETPDNQLVYTWSVSPNRGTISEIGRTLGGSLQPLGTATRTVTWTSPHLQQSPDTYTITLNVTENYTGADGQPKQNQAAPRSVVVRYNDSYRDVDRKAHRYLTQLFPDFNVSPSQAVQDFSDSCPGKANEQSDVVMNRANYHILSGTFNGVVTLNAGNVTATDVGPCTFTDIPTNPADPNYGRRETVQGICTMTAVYENWDWFLCDSLFRGTGVIIGSPRGRVPGGSSADSSPR